MKALSVLSVFSVFVLLISCQKDDMSTKSSLMNIEIESAVDDTIFIGQSISEVTFYNKETTRIFSKELNGYILGKEYKDGKWCFKFPGSALFEAVVALENRLFLVTTNNISNFDKESYIETQPLFYDGVNCASANYSDFNLSKPFRLMSLEQGINALRSTNYFNPTVSTETCTHSCQGNINSAALCAMSGAVMACPKGLASGSKQVTICDNGSNGTNNCISTVTYNCLGEE